MANMHPENHSLLISVDALLDEKMLNVNRRQVLFDYQAAELFQEKTNYLLRKVRANIERFPSDFMFELTRKELRQLLSPAQKNRRKLYFFTWGGLMQAAGLFHTKRAVEIHLQLVRRYGKGIFRS